LYIYLGRESSSMPSQVHSEIRCAFKGAVDDNYLTIIKAAHFVAHLNTYAVTKRFKTLARKFGGIK